MNRAKNVIPEQLQCFCCCFLCSYSFWSLSYWIVWYIFNVKSMPHSPIWHTNSILTCIRIWFSCSFNARFRTNSGSSWSSRNSGHRFGHLCHHVRWQKVDSFFDDAVRWHRMLVHHIYGGSAEHPVAEDHIFDVGWVSAHLLETARAYEWWQFLRRSIFHLFMQKVFWLFCFTEFHDFLPSFIARYTIVFFFHHFVIKFLGHARR